MIGKSLLNTSVLLNIVSILKKLQKNDTLSMDQKTILAEFQSFYAKLFKNVDSNLENINLEEALKHSQTQKVHSVHFNQIEGHLTIKELSQALKQTKNNKTPGIDGFPADFLKVFWTELCVWIQQALNTSYDKRKLSISLRQCLIICLPKKDKNREEINNWRPLSMLSSIYKLASAAIANRIKPILNYLIDRSQTGFISGRNIAESTRLVYDIIHTTDKLNIPGLLVSIDFQKAFDSISWKFIFKTLSYLGFGPNLQRWIKLLNTDITAKVLQNGFLSKSIQIQRGCRQGDPISPYLFIIAAQILTLLIINNPEIRGIFINGVEFKITQYADDTTLLLDGSQNSLTAALNTLEIFGTYSGLKMNTEKTRVVWIGKKRHSTEKLMDKGLLWGCTNFDLLGINFSNNLTDMIDSNYKKKICEIKNLINIWEKRYLTPIGKVTVIKTFILAKLNHLFLALPNPNPQLLSKIEDLCYKFLWSNKPDKINRNIVTLDIQSGGLNMVNLKLFIKSLKTTWFRKLLRQTDAPWNMLFQASFGKNFQKCSGFGPEYILELKKNITNKFWNDVFEAAYNILENQQLKTSNQILTTPLWYNKKLSNETFCISHWYKNGIQSISDVLDDNGKFMSLDTMKNLYSLREINFLHYLRVKSICNELLKRSNFQYINFSRPYIPNHVKILYRSNKGARDFYKYVNKITKNNHSMKAKWNVDLSFKIDEPSWCDIFKVCFNTTNDNSLVSTACGL